MPTMLLLKNGTQQLFILSAFTELQKATSFVMSVVCLFVCPFVRIEQVQLPVDGFSSILIFEYFSKICRENSSLIKM